MEFDPLGIFLATLCTGGEKLLFRYPSEAEENHNKPNIGELMLLIMLATITNERKLLTKPYLSTNQVVH